MRKLLLASTFLCSGAAAQTVNPPIIPPGGGINLFTNNVFTGTNTFNNAVTLNNTLIITGCTGIVFGVNTSPISCFLGANSRSLGYSSAGVAYNVPRAIEATDYMTAAQIADGTSRTDSLDVTTAVNSCITQAYVLQSRCHLTAGKWKAAAAQINLQGSYAITAVSGSANSYTFTVPGMPVVPIGSTLIVQATLPATAGATLNGAGTVTASSLGSVTITTAYNATWTSGGAVTFINNIDFYGDGPSETTLDVSANATAPPIIIQAPGGTAQTNSISMSYGGIQYMNLLGSAAGPVLQDGLATFYDAQNQQSFYNVSIQNFNTTSVSNCAQFNYVLSATALSVNCSSSAGPTGGNDLFQMRFVSFGFWNLGGSNGSTFLNMASGVSSGNVFMNFDCEVVRTCLAISAGSQDNIFVGGTWSWNWGSTGYNAVSATSGSNNGIFLPNQNPNTTTGAAGTFLSSASVGHAQLYTQSTINNTAASPVTQATYTNPSGLSAAGMAGLGGSCNITPTASGRIRFEFQGDVTNNGANITSIQLRYGTGAAPANGTAVTGTAVGSSVSESGTSTYPFTLSGIVTGFTIGTNVWFDMSITPTSGVGTVVNSSCQAMEY